jgi:hypothetical protein
MRADNFLVHSRFSNNGADLLSLPRHAADWEWMSFFVRRLEPGQTYTAHLLSEEAAVVLLGGQCSADWGAGECRRVTRINVSSCPVQLKAGADQVDPILNAPKHGRDPPCLKAAAHCRRDSSGNTRYSRARQQQGGTIRYQHCVAVVHCECKTAIPARE